MPPIIHLEETNSTNIYLKILLLQQEVEEGAVVYTDFQTAGKGQRGNSWESEKSKNLLFSMVLYPKAIKASEQFIISQIVSVAIANYLSTHTKDISIKWPNDIYWKEKKICGILIENSLIGDSIKESVIGIGINLNQETFVSDAPNPVSLKQITGIEYDLSSVLNAIRDNILQLYTQRNIPEIIQNYKQSLFRREGYYLYNDGCSDFTAKIKDILPNGLLILETKDGEERKFAFKEVKYII